MNSSPSVSHLTDFDRIIIYDVLIGQININILSQEKWHQDLQGSIFQILFSSIFSARKRSLVYVVHWRTAPT